MLSKSGKAKQNKICLRQKMQQLEFSQIDSESPTPTTTVVPVPILSNSAAYQKIRNKELNAYIAKSIKL